MYPSALREPREIDARHRRSRAWQAVMCCQPVVDIGEVLGRESRLSAGRLFVTKSLKKKSTSPLLHGLGERDREGRKKSVASGCEESGSAWTPSHCSAKFGAKIAFRVCQHAGELRLQFHRIINFPALRRLEKSASSGMLP